MTLPVVTVVAIPFPTGVMNVTLSGALLGVFLTAGQSAPGAVLVIAVAIDQGTPSGYEPIFINSAPLNIPVGNGAYFPIPADIQNLPARVQLQLQNVGAATSVALVTAGSTAPTFDILTESGSPLTTESGVRIELENGP